MELDGCPRVFTRKDAAPLAVRADDEPPSIAMDDLPIPDFADFFEQWSSLDALSERTPGLLFESSRGCWWGAHAPLHVLRPERRDDELPQQVAGQGRRRDCARWRGPSPGPGDLRRRQHHRPRLLRHLPARRWRRRRATPASSTRSRPTSPRSNSSNSHEAGVRDIQPGVESLHDSVLRMMRKGVTRDRERAAAEVVRRDRRPAVLESDLGLSR